jgi:hypothetical protein
MVGQDVLDEPVFLLQCHVADIMTEIAFFADVTRLSTAVVCLRYGFESLSVVDVYRDTRGKCTRRGVE